MTTMTAQTTQIYELFIRATPEKIWEAITRPEFTSRYFHGATIETTPEVRRSSLGRGLDDVQEVLEYEPPHRLVHGWTSFYDPEMAAEEPSRVTWEIEAKDDGVCLLRVVHDRLEGAPKTAASVAGPGWMWVLSGLKSLLETGEPLS